MFYRHLKNELWKLFGKKRTYIGFGAFLVAQNAMLLIFRLNGHKHMERLLEGNGYLAEHFISALSVAIIMLAPQIILLMPLYAALVGGDLVAKEAEDGTLRMILSRPISRFNLLLAKWLAGVLFSIVLVVVLGAMALILARLWFPWRGLFISFPPLLPFSVLPAGEGLKFFALSHLLLAINASVVLGIAFMFSCFNMKPAAATILALTVLFISFVMEQIPFFEDYREWLLTYHFHAWLLLFAKPIPWSRILGSLAILAAFNLSAFLVGTAAFQARDIKS
jgi:ABC-2 type transport system permease protein